MFNSRSPRLSAEHTASERGYDSRINRIGGAASNWNTTGSGGLDYGTYHEHIYRIGLANGASGRPIHAGAIRCFRESESRNFNDLALIFLNAARGRVYARGDG
jgi:hypothetical protein